MSTREAEKKTKEEVIAEIRRLAEVYTPEWKFDTEHPDAGTALALIFADMFSGTVRRYNCIPEKLKGGFFEQLGIKTLPAVPAEGYVTFGLSSHEFGGVQIPKGTVVMAENQGGENVVYETTEPVCVVPSKLTTVFFLDGREDYFEKKEFHKPFMAFLPEGRNLQEHELYLCQDEVFFVTGEAQIWMKLKAYSRSGEDSDLSWLMDKEAFSVAYGTEEGFEEFAKRSMERGYLVLSRSEGQPEAKETELFGKNGLWIRCRYKKPWKRDPFVVQDIRLAAKKDGMEPDHIYNQEGEQQNASLFPFGECPAPFGECYFSSKEALGKSGARVRITFMLEYERIPLDNSVKAEKKWKFLMKRSDFKPDPEYDITIEQVVWEYYNGSGWSRLLLPSEGQNIFDGKNGGMGGRMELEFICPEDAALLEWQSAPTRYIRVRVLRMNNLYKLKGAYITPVISDIRFHYFYTGEGRHPDAVAVASRMEQTLLPAAELKKGPVRWEIFYGLREKAPGLYLGFDRPLSDGPVKLYMDIEGQSCPTEKMTGIEQPRLIFEYYGKNGFIPLDVFDETEELQKSGCLTFFGKEDFSSGSFCGETAYWIRVTEKRDSRDKYKKGKKLTKICGIYLNTAKVLAVESMAPEYFEIQAGEKNKVCRLSRGNIFELSVLVDGEKWEEVEDFNCSKEYDRHYVLDRSNGIVAFSDGKKGAIPCTEVCIRYRCGGGEKGNCPPGAVNRLGAAYGYLNRVKNHGLICGGYDQESYSGAIRRGAENLRHMGRAVTASDYEALTHEASRFVWKVKCYPGYNLRGEYEPGSITLVVLQKEFKDGRVYFQKIREEILKYLSGRMGGNLAVTGRLFVTEPQFFELDCYVKAVVEDMERVLEVQRSVEERLEEFIHPVTGNYHGRGWDIGTIPNETQILNALKGISGVSFIRELRLSVFIPTVQGRREIQPDGRDKKALSFGAVFRFAVALGGKNTVVVEVEK